MRNMISLFRRVGVALLLGASFVVSASGAEAATPRVSIFFYPWYSNPARDGEYRHWQQNGHRPPADIATNFYPLRGAYSSSDQRVLAAQMRELRAAVVDQVVVSWWGRESIEHARLPAILAAARREKLRVAIHVEPYPGRTAASTERDVQLLRGRGIRDYYVYEPSGIPADEWARVNDRLRGVRVFAQTGKVGFAAAGRFDGIYTYDILAFTGAKFARICGQARERRLLCLPSVGPGYLAARAGRDRRVKPRRSGLTYDSMWLSAIRAGADAITITSYNEWHEGTQIEPARAGQRGYEGYEGAWGLRGRQAETAYLDRTAYWVGRFTR